jgi:hypothetical protein
MKTILALCLAVLCSRNTAPAEILDRLAVSVGREIITEKQILLALRVSSFLNGQPLSLSARAKRAAAQKHLELTLIRVEIDQSKYPPPTPAQIDSALADLKKQLFGGDEGAYQRTLSRYTITEPDLRDSIRWQLITLAFIEFRFRPAVQIPEQEIVEYYRNEYLAKIPAGGAAQDFLDVRAALLEILTQQRIDNLLDRWLSQAQNQTTIRWIDSVFAEEREP